LPNSIAFCEKVWYNIIVIKKKGGVNAETIKSNFNSAAGDIINNINGLR